MLKKQRVTISVMDGRYAFDDQLCISVIASLLNTDKGSFSLLQSLKNLLHAFVVDTQ
jgi:hypothetical protein